MHELRIPKRSEGRYGLLRSIRPKTLKDVDIGVDQARITNTQKWDLS